MLEPKESTIQLSNVKLGGEDFYKISGVDQMSPFLMSIVSDSNHWMFISSNGGLTAGRKNPDHALFPYYTDDKLTEMADHTGSQSIFRCVRHGETHVWEPFSERSADKYHTTYNLYKSVLGNKVRFECVNHTLQLGFSYEWNSSNLFGFVRSCQLSNLSADPIEVALLDGLQNLMPHGVSADLQTRSSNLVDAYKRNELHEASGLAVYALSAIIVDKAEPSEALKANTVWSCGLRDAQYLLSTRQVAAFRSVEKVVGEVDEKARKGAYFCVGQVSLDAKATTTWHMVANIGQGPAEVINLTEKLKQPDQLFEQVTQDVALGCHRLRVRVGSADGFQKTADHRRNGRHYANVLFNIMRGGIFDDQYRIEKWDLTNYLFSANRMRHAEWTKLMDSLPENFAYLDLKNQLSTTDQPDLIRLITEYLPLKFSRRHGDPSRPWNQFSINTRNELDGSKILDYEGNWRDIFQNWEALAYSYPGFLEGMIFKFLNASTADGYNPYRVTKDGFDWEISDPDDPWSYIGYWGDHQIIYLLKFLELNEQMYPGRLNEYLNKPLFVYAHVPYRIKPYEAILEDPQDTIEFDASLDYQIRKKRAEMGADGALLHGRNGLVRASMLEKLWVTLLAKLSNFVPEGGIWMNTQRPEWNDANNALVGNGLSMVTLAYLRRFCFFFKALIKNSQTGEVYQFATEINGLFNGIQEALLRFEDRLATGFSGAGRRQLMDLLGRAGGRYRQQLYAEGFSGHSEPIEASELVDFIDLVLRYLDQSIRANKRKDGMYHAYNLLDQTSGEATISRLDMMLEGQVAVLSSGLLDPDEALEVMDSLKSSPLFRPDQYTYLLYPNKDLPGFLQKNNLPGKAVEAIPLLKELLAHGNGQIVEQDVLGGYHFNGRFKNAKDVKIVLDQLPEGYLEGVRRDKPKILALFEDTFNHKAFTGRSGTFYGYEGLGSIYWHMVSKLLLAVQECCIGASREGADARVVGGLLDHYYEINAGIGASKPPELYGAFPTDPYSHTPMNKGAQQPGMTGQVKEDILCRWRELGVFVSEGCISFHPVLLLRSEFLKTPAELEYVTLDGEAARVALNKDTIGFTYCQVPVVYSLSDEAGIDLHKADGQQVTIKGLRLSPAISQEIFHRSGEVVQIDVHLPPKYLK